MDAPMSPEALTHFKVNHPDVSNDIVQMRSSAFQVPFYLGGSQIPAYLKKIKH